MQATIEILLDRLCVTLLLCSIAATSIAAPARLDALDADARFAAWADIASASTVSPAKAEPGDLMSRWTGPDGREIKLVVKAPRPRAGAATVKLGPLAPDEDARPHFEAALDKVRQ